MTTIVEGDLLGDFRREVAGLRKLGLELWFAEPVALALERSHADCGEFIKDLAQLEHELTEQEKLIAALRVEIEALGGDPDRVKA